MPKSFVAPKSRTPRSAENDAAKLEAKKQFKLLSTDPEKSEPSEQIATLEEEARPITPPTTVVDSGQAVASIPQAFERVNSATLPSVDASVSPTTKTEVDQHVSPLPTNEILSAIKEEELRSSATSSRSGMQHTVVAESNPFPRDSPAYRATEYRISEGRSAQNRKQISLYPSEETMFRLEMIRVRDRIGSAMIIEHALSEYLKSHTDEEIVAVMRSQGHRLRRARG